jgi:hypothetical protein
MKLLCIKTSCYRSGILLEYNELIPGDYYESIDDESLINVVVEINGFEVKIPKELFKTIIEVRNDKLNELGI